MSYGKLPNTHLIQKYGFVLKDNPVKQSIIRIPYHDYSAFLYEESALKKKVSQRLRIPFNQNFLSATLHTDKFDGSIMQQLRLSFITSKTLMDIGGSHHIDNHDFKTYLDKNTESMAYDFLIQSLESNLGDLKPLDHYQNIIEDAK